MTTHIQRSALLPYPAQFLYDLVNDVARYPGISAVVLFG